MGSFFNDLLGNMLLVLDPKRRASAALVLQVLLPPLSFLSSFLPPPLSSFISASLRPPFLSPRLPSPSATPSAQIQIFSAFFLPLRPLPVTLSLQLSISVA